LVPGTATLGTTRLRARMVYTGTLSPCGTSSYGEVEDYLVTIIAGGPFDDASVSPLSIAYNRIGSCSTCFDVEATVTNSGNTNTAFDVLASIAGTSYSQTISGVLLAPGASTLLAFPDFDPSGVATGSYTLTVTAQMTGDANPSNDAKSFTFDVTTEDFGYDDGTAEQGLGFNTATGILVNGFTFCENRILEDIVVWITTNVGDPATEQFAISLWNADGVAGEPGTLLQTVVSPITYNAAGVTLGGWNTFTLSTPLAITAGTMIYVGVEQSTASVTGTWPLGNDQSRPLSGALADISWNAALGGGIGAWSNTAAAGINFLTMIRVNACGSACPSPQDPVAISSVQQSGSDVVLIWGASTGATSYNVYWDTIPGGTTNSQTVGNVLTWTDVGASSLTNRFYTVTATCAAPVASPNSKGTASVSVVAPKSNAQKVTLSTSNSSRKKLQR
ncbi:hypothetical protein IT568_13340, partial [bacterium]|nr:hypothetical protein [bacterium]